MTVGNRGSGGVADSWSFLARRALPNPHVRAGPCRGWLQVTSPAPAIVAETFLAAPTYRTCDEYFSGRVYLARRIRLASAAVRPQKPFGATVDPSINLSPRTRLARQRWPAARRRTLLANGGLTKTTARSTSSSFNRSRAAALRSEDTVTRNADE